jgi:hypothetical protein
VLHEKVESPERVEGHVVYVNQMSELTEVYCLYTGVIFEYIQLRGTAY